MNKTQSVDGRPRIGPANELFLAFLGHVVVELTNMCSKFVLQKAHSPRKSGQHCVLQMPGNSLARVTGDLVPVGTPQMLQRGGAASAENAKQRLDLAENI